MKKAYIIPQTHEDIILAEQILSGSTEKASIDVDNNASSTLLEGDARGENNLFGNEDW